MGEIDNRFVTYAAAIDRSRWSGEDPPATRRVSNLHPWGVYDERSAGARMVLQTNSPQEADEMLTKTRTTIIALIASASFAPAAIAPAVSSAQKIDTGSHAATCEVYRLTYELWDELHENAAANGQYDLAAYYAEQETAARDAATAEGCSWPSAALAKTVKLPATIVKPIALKPVHRG
jgi:hypothetical protein